MKIITEIIEGELVVTLNARLEDWDKVSEVMKIYLEYFEKLTNK